MSRGVKLIGESTLGLFRTSQRAAPHNLYADTARVRQTADARSYSNDPPQWIYRVDEWHIPETPATTVVLSWSPQSVVTWRYEDGRYERSYGNSPHNYVTESGDRGQLTVDVLVILTGREYTASPLIPGDGTPVPATETTGHGDAWVISRGGVWTGTWEREEITDQFTLLNADGTETVVPAGIAGVDISQQPDDHDFVTVAVIAARVHAGASARGEIDQALERVAADRFNAFIERDADALNRADAIDAAAAAGSDPGPLAGVPIGLKDIIDHEGRTTTAGSSFYRNHAQRSAPVVSRVEAAGAVIVGRTGLHEFAYGFSSENDWFGPVRNPWDPTTSPGGSSGGSAVAVAAGIVPVAIGTDTGGSVRVPAALCGCMGLKVTHGRVPLTGVFPLASSLDTVGPIATTVADLAAVYAVIAGDDPDDPWSSPRPVTIPNGPATLSGLRVGVPHPWLDRPLSSPHSCRLRRIHCSTRQSRNGGRSGIGADPRPDGTPPRVVRRDRCGPPRLDHREIHRATDSRFETACSPTWRTPPTPSPRR